MNNKALLTIDDVPSRNTPAIVDYLNAKGIPAIMFVTGQNTEQYWNEAVYALQHGMILGNHSYTHPHFSELTMEEAVVEIQRCEEVLDRLYAAAGVERKWRPFRFPFGDKGGPIKDQLQQYFRAQGFDKVDDRHFPYTWWRESELATDIDTLWTYDFEEYRLSQDPTFSQEQIWAKMANPAPAQGAALFGDGNEHMFLLHAHDITDEILPGYYRLFLDHLLENGMQFVEPKFI